MLEEKEILIKYIKSNILSYHFPMGLFGASGNKECK